MTMDTETRIVTMLDGLGELHAQRDLIECDKQRAIDAVLTPEIVKRIADISTEFAARSQGPDADIEKLQETIKSEVVLHGQSIKGARLQAVWQKGRVSWNAAALEGYAAAHPEIKAFRSQGEPSVSIRLIGGRT